MSSRAVAYIVEMAETLALAQKSTRSLNMAKRRDLILVHARQIIAEDGYEALKLRDIAARAGVTVPTIYNLIGGKAEILALIIEDLVARLLTVQERSVRGDIESELTMQIEKMAELFEADEKYYRAAFIAGDRNGLFEQSTDDGIFARSIRMPTDACRDAIKTGLLYGRVSAEQMGRQVYGCYRLARQDWVNGYFDLKGFRQQALTGIFLCLAADAKPAFHKRLMMKIKALSGA